MRHGLYRHDKTRGAGLPVVIGVILAGGRANRLGGGDKGMQTVGGRTILARVAEVLRSGCQTVILNANGDPGRFASFGLPVVADSLPGHPGPLAGVVAALEWAATRPEAGDAIVTAPGDTPFLPPDLVARLAETHRQAQATVTCARSGGIRHPVAAVWSLALRAELRRAVAAEDMRRMGAFLDRHPVATVDWPSDPVDPFFNVNTPAELALASALAAEVDRHRAG